MSHSNRSNTFLKALGALKGKERARMESETLLLYHHDGYKVVVPMSYEANFYWKQESQSCTLEDEARRMCHHAHYLNPTVIVFTPDGHKIWFNKEHPPIVMSEKDGIKKDILDIISPLIITLCLYFTNLRGIPDHLKTYELCLAAVKNNGSQLQYVPFRFLDRNMYLESVNYNMDNG